MAVVLGLDFKWFHHTPEQHEQYGTQKAGNGLSSEDVFNKSNPKLWSTGRAELDKAAEMSHNIIKSYNLVDGLFV